MFLEKMKAMKASEIARLEEQLTGDDWRRAVALPKGRAFRTAIESSDFAVIAEVKPASPSKGVIAANVNPVVQALKYEQGGATAISVLTETEYFHGKPESLTAVREAVSLPVLRKDFILHPLQVLESKLLGADVILLIVAFLTPDRCAWLVDIAHQLGMEVLIEIHQVSEIESALQAGGDVIGINNRNLSSLQVDITTTHTLRPLLPTTQPVIGESGILSLTDAKTVAAANIDGVLVGEYLMRSADPVTALTELRQVGAARS
jgi:indole-3-glycerol phosphate synthase